MKFIKILLIVVLISNVSIISLLVFNNKPIPTQNNLENPKDIDSEKKSEGKQSDETTDDKHLTPKVRSFETKDSKLSDEFVKATVFTMFNNYLKEDFIKPEGVLAVNGWVLKLPSGKKKSRTTLQLQAAPIIALGIQAIPHLFEWTIDKHAYIRYIACYALEKISGSSPIYEFIAWNKDAENIDKEKALIVWDNWIEELNFSDLIIPGVLPPEISTPIVKGLRVNVFAEKKVYKLGEPMNIIVVLRNKTNSIIKLKPSIYKTTRTNQWMCGFNYNVSNGTPYPLIFNDFGHSVTTVNIPPNAVYSYKMDIQTGFNLNNVTGKITLNVYLHRELGFNDEIIKSNNIEFEVVK